MAEPERLGEIIAAPPRCLLKGRKLKLELLKLNWRGIAGDEECRHSAPTRLARKALTVAADGPSWAAELSIKAEAMLRRIEGVIGKGEVQKIKIQARSAGLRNEATGGKAPGKEEYADGAEAVELSPGLREELESVPQEETRSALERLLKASVASKQGKPSGCQGRKSA